MVFMASGAETCTNSAGQSMNSDRASARCVASLSTIGGREVPWCQGSVLPCFSRERVMNSIMSLFSAWITGRREGVEREGEGEGEGGGEGARTDCDAVLAGSKHELEDLEVGELEGGVGGVDFDARDAVGDEDGELLVHRLLARVRHDDVETVVAHGVPRSEIVVVLDGLEHRLSPVLDREGDDGRRSAWAARATSALPPSFLEREKKKGTRSSPPSALLVAVVQSSDERAPADLLADWAT